MQPTADVHFGLWVSFYVMIGTSAAALVRLIFAVISPSSVLTTPTNDREPNERRGAAMRRSL